MYCNLRILSSRKYDLLYKNKNKRVRSNLPDRQKPTGATIKELYPYYLEYIHLHRKSNTHTDVKIAGGHIKRLIGDTKIEDINNIHINLYKKHRLNEPGLKKDSTISSRTINKELSWLSGFLRWCKKNTELNVPKIEIERLPYKRPIPVILSIQECKAILNELKPVYRGLVACLYLTGMRYNEAARLLKTDFDLDNSLVYVRDTKSGIPKVLGIPLWLKDLLEEISKENDKSIYMFPSRKTGMPIVNIKSALKNACKKAGINKHVYPHLFRHSIASHLLSLNYSTRIIQSFLGHSQISQTEWYTQVALQAKADIAFTLNSLMGQGVLHNVDNSEYDNC